MPISEYNSATDGHVTNSVHESIYYTASESTPLASDYHSNFSFDTMYLVQSTPVCIENAELKILYTWFIINIIAFIYLLYRIIIDNNL